METQKLLIMSDIDDTFIEEKSHVYAEKVSDCTYALSNRIVFIDGISIAFLNQEEHILHSVWYTMATNGIISLSFKPSLVLIVFLSISMDQSRA